ncbi:MAG: DHHW family protein [Eubacteriales bacterium]|nr:DHHW family protein [Eubacteriales bacterium]
MKKKQQWVIIVFFLLMIFGFTFAGLVKPDTDFSEKENRVLAKMPEVDLEDIFDGTFSADYETYLTDQFFFRDSWIGIKTKTERLAGKQEINDIYFADDGYLIEKHTGDFETATAEQNVKTLSAFLEEQVNNYGADHVTAMIAPNAVSILKDKLPPFAVCVQEDEYLDEIVRSLPEGTFLDLRDVLEEHCEEYIYYRTDHHWTTLGARYAYDAWARKTALNALPAQNYEREVLTDIFYGTVEAKVGYPVRADVIERWNPKTEVPYTLSYNHKTEEVKDSLYEESSLGTRDKYAVFFGGNQPLTEIKTQAGTGRRLLVIKDSYAHCFVPFAVQDFDEISMIDLRYFNESLKEYMENNDFSDILFLYNASGFAQDSAVVKLGN